jgi:hypothetical protein
MPKKTESEKRSEAARTLSKGNNQKAGIARWANKSVEERKAHAAHMNTSNSKWVKHLEKLKEQGFL